MGHLPHSTRTLNATRHALCAWTTQYATHMNHIPNPFADNDRQSGSGLQHTKLSKAILKRAIGPEVMRAVASLKASGVEIAEQEGSADSRHGSSSALNNLIGTETSGGALQVTIVGRGKGVTA